MANIKKWLEEAEKHFGETIESIVVGRHDTEWRNPAKDDENVLLPREVALEKLDVDFDNGYGGADCFPIYAWTASRVFFIDEYDGATGLAWVPRHPASCSPQFSGDGV